MAKRQNGKCNKHSAQVISQHIKYAIKWPMAKTKTRRSNDQSARGGGRRLGKTGRKPWMETLGGCCQKVKAIRHTPKKMRPAATKLKREMAVVKMGGKWGEKSKC